ncbi:hypothetical protein DP939_08395 [Spongiactinospora rosea]|uniref:DUF4440 domain-containing protein n=1 Tax=Spongiactinospora rosea TaxID=2248750 RepID=A0A366M4F4_9ACTN|nr:SDR family NAD(P)-dependent oxidoreductase [Spongiactinospora rosea]RBQ21061.1 hypothetical protein DP939_08395 [Spongiactinospora rosea]
MPGAVVIGAGPGVGRSVARRFAREGLPITLIARNPATLADTAKALAPFDVPVLPLIADSTDEPALRAALDRSVDELGLPDALIYNAALIQPDHPGQSSASTQLNAWAVNVVGALTAAAHLAPAMARRGTGSIIITGGMPEPKPDYVSLSLGKAGVRTLVTLLHQEYGPSGLHAASVTIPAPVAPGTPFAPDTIADHYWHLHTQPRDEWQHEIVHNGAYDAIAGLMERWRSAFNARRTSDLAALFTEDALFQGISPRLLFGRAEISEYYNNVAEGTKAHLEVLRTKPLHDGIAAGFANVTFTAPTGNTVSVRLSIVAQRVGDIWLIRQYHAAGPVRDGE